MERTNKDKEKKKVYKEKLREAERKIDVLTMELKLVREERDRMIGEKCLATAKYKEHIEEVASIQERYQSLENSYIKQKLDHINLKSNHESLAEDFEVLKKLLSSRDKEIQALTKQHDQKRKAHPDTPTRNKELLKPPQINKNIRPFPSTSFSFNLISSNKNFFASSFRDDDH